MAQHYEKSNRCVRTSLRKAEFDRTCLHLSATFCPCLSSKKSRTCYRKLAVGLSWHTLKQWGVLGVNFQHALLLRILLNHCKQGTYALRVPDTSLLSMQTTGLGICQHIEASTALNKSLQSVPEMVPLVESQLHCLQRGKCAKTAFGPSFYAKKSHDWKPCLLSKCLKTPRRRMLGQST